MPARHAMAMITEGFLPECGDDPIHSHTSNPTIGKLPDEILLWIFDFCRQLSSERGWNSRNGWFKLAHVCRNWRHIILSSSSRLRLRLYFTEKTFTRANVLTSLPRLPIIVDYLDHDLSIFRIESAHWQNRLKSVRRYRDRVCGIAIAAATRTSFETISKALNTCFPTLESLELDIRMEEFHFGPRFLGTSMKSLRRLKIVTLARLSLLFTLLSTTTALIDLTLTVDTVMCPLSGITLLLCLQCLPCLRHLDVCVRHHHIPSLLAMPPTRTKMNDLVSLAELINFRFEGYPPQLEELVAGLAFPSLQELHVSLFLLGLQITQFQIPHLTKLVHNAGMIFFAAEVKFSSRHCNISLLTHSHFVDEPSFNIIIGHNRKSTAQLGSALSALLATVEDVLFVFHLTAGYTRSSHVKLAPWRGFFERLPNVKILRVQYGLEGEVADMLQRGNMQPKGLRPISAIFPNLEEIEVLMNSPGTPIPESGCASAHRLFEAFVAARQQDGHPVTVYCNTDLVLPASFYDVRGWPER